MDIYISNRNGIVEGKIDSHILLHLLSHSTDSNDLYERVVNHPSFICGEYRGQDAVLIKFYRRRVAIICNGRLSYTIASFRDPRDLSYIRSFLEKSPDPAENATTFRSEDETEFEILSSPAPKLSHPTFSGVGVDVFDLLSLSRRDDAREGEHKFKGVGYVIMSCGKEGRGRKMMRILSPSSPLLLYERLGRLYYRSGFSAMASAVAKLPSAEVGRPAWIYTLFSSFAPSSSEERRRVYVEGVFNDPHIIQPGIFSPLCRFGFSSSWGDGNNEQEEETRFTYIDRLLVGVGRFFSMVYGNGDGNRYRKEQKRQKGHLFTCRWVRRGGVLGVSPLFYWEPPLSEGDLIREFFFHDYGSLYTAPNHIKPKGSLKVKREAFEGYPIFCYTFYPSRPCFDVGIEGLPVFYRIEKMSSMTRPFDEFSVSWHGVRNVLEFLFFCWQHLLLCDDNDFQVSSLAYSVS